MNDITRREFVAGSAASMLMPASFAVTSSRKTLNVALVGCGGRGRGVLKNLLEASKAVGCNVRAVAFCDWFEDVAMKMRDTFSIPGAKVCSGANGYKEVMAMKNVDAVLLVTPIGFRPLHFKAAVDAGKHVFEEKAVAVDGPGVRMHLEAAKKSV